jgi:phosphate uptake regulator
MELTSSSQLADFTTKMLRMCLDALVQMDVDMVYDVRDMDSTVNKMCDEAYNIMKKTLICPKLFSEHS